jgi:hypothetical protein
MTNKCDDCGSEKLDFREIRDTKDELIKIKICMKCGAIALRY